MEDNAKIKIFIVDDNVELCEVLQEAFNGEEDMEVVGIAQDGMEAIDMISTLLPDLVLLDAVMPRLDGLGVLCELTKQGLSPRPRVMILTAMGTERAMETFKAYGADSYMVKPFNLHDLIEKIRALFNGSPGTPQGGIRDKLILHIAQDPNGIELAIDELLCATGIPTNRKGFLYLRSSLMLALKEPKRLIAVTTLIFPQVAEEYSTTSNGVQAAIRNAIRSVWQSTDRSQLKGVFQENFLQRFEETPPNNGEFIAHLVEILQDCYISAKSQSMR
jgi:two-component system response regulator (stage 0 sporulation protein A)